MHDTLGTWKKHACTQPCMFRGSMLMLANTMTSIAKSKLVSAIGFAIVAALVYLGVKHFFRGLSDRDLWMALVVAVIVGVGSSLPWRNARKKD